MNLYIPSSYDSQTPAPLVILLHGYGFNGADQENYMQFRPLAEARRFLYCHPDSMPDRVGTQFWNATDSCCDYFDTGTDDAGYLRAVIEEIGRQFAVDRKRIHLIGWSNGAVMAYRMACQSADLIAAIASLSDDTFLDPSRCAPSEPVNILEIHGTADNIAPYAGGALTTTGQAIQAPANMPAYPGALQTVHYWAGYNGARDPVTDPGPSMDLDLDVPGLDTVITRYTNYPPGGAVELWTHQRWQPRTDLLQWQFLLGVCAPGYRLASRPSQTVSAATDFYQALSQRLLDQLAEQRSRDGTGKEVFHRIPFRV